MAVAHEECGIAAVFIPKNSKESDKAAYYIYKLLLNMQARGQLSAGLTTFHPKQPKLLRNYRNLGSVNEVFKTTRPAKRNELFMRHKSNKAIGHVRYATCGADDRDYAMPFERKHGRKWKWFTFGFNGQLANYAELKKHLMEKTDYHMTRDTDTEIFMHYIANELRGPKKPDPVKVCNTLSKALDGAYNCTFMNAYGDIVVTRDPMGFKPLCYGYKDDILLVASESNALLNCGISADDVKDLQPGHLIAIEDEKVHIKKYAEGPRLSHCMFEWVYFANVASTIDKKSVYLTRNNLGKNLAKIEKVKIDKDFIVVPVPDTSRASADALAWSLGLPVKEGLIRNRHVGRTFIESSDRDNKVKHKFTVLKRVVKGKKIILVDDSIVRGTTSKNIVKYLKEQGAKEVHVRISCPPIRHPCFYGIDFSTHGELIAAKNSDDIYREELTQKELDKIAKNMHADSLVYMPLHLLIESIGIPSKDLCYACLTGKYPTACGQKLHEAAAKDYLKKGGNKNKDNKKDKNKRTYE
jgi:amidophosphoribosyltransferase